MPNAGPTSGICTSTGGWSPPKRCCWRHAAGCWPSCCCARAGIGLDRLPPAGPPQALRPRRQHGDHLDDPLGHAVRAGRPLRVCLLRVRVTESAEEVGKLPNAACGRNQIRISNPKSETNSKLEIQMFKTNPSTCASFGFWSFGFWICFVFRASDFVFPTCAHARASYGLRL